MGMFYFVVNLPPFMEALVDVFLLALLSTPFIYIFVLRPIEMVFIRQKKLEEFMLHTKRHEIDEQLKKFSNALIQTNDAVSITDREGIIEYVNPAFESLTKYSKNELIGKNRQS